MMLNMHRLTHCRKAIYSATWNNYNRMTNCGTHEERRRDRTPAGTRDRQSDGLTEIARLDID